MIRAFLDNPAAPLLVFGIFLTLLGLLSIVVAATGWSCR